ncbi:hypothetical protein B6U99_07485 [Candidatus Geothermarchaeota archaeon ex4572_27]|nr:MAG: hypothetical protein B6U99_07485 [Candidatus Geothermarchaeota archaeon ex4572_27]
MIEVASSTVITEAILTVAAMVSLAVVLAAFMPSLYYLESAHQGYVMRLKTELETEVKVIFASGAVGSNEVKIWVKNVGSTSIPSELIGEASDLLFGPEGGFKRIPYGSSTLPTWSYTIVNDRDSDDDWDPQETIEIRLLFDENLTEGDYYVRFAVYTGSYDEYTFSL